jgi:hypothetical protein
MKKLLLGVLLLGAMSSLVYGRDREEGGDGIISDHVPEIDPNSAISALFLLSSGVLMMKGRRKQ